MVRNVIQLYVFIILIYILICKFSVAVFNPKKLPVIIWWTDLLYPHSNKSNEIQCPLGNCLSSTKRKLKTDAVPISYMFYGTDFQGTDLPLPRKSNHIWALLHEESPLNNYIFTHSPGIKLFNFTATFSRESNFPLTIQHLPSLEYLMRRPTPLAIKNNFRKNGTSPVMYLQSHCNVASDRDRYIRELMKFIDVDSYGSCLHNKDLPSALNSTDTHDEEILFDFISRYKFHLAFENALCDDYITEKLYRALHVGSVPIYKGSPSVKDWLPSDQSAVVVDDFKSPEELAAFVSELDKNDTLYEKYLSYKLHITNEFLKNQILNRKWGVNDPNKLDFIKSYECYLCDKLQIVHNLPLSIANKNHMNCPQPHPSLSLNISESIKDNIWLQEEWAETYWFAYDQAKAIELMIQNKDNDTSNFWEYVSQNKN